LVTTNKNVIRPNDYSNIKIKMDGDTSSLCTDEELNDSPHSLDESMAKAKTASIGKTEALKASNPGFNFWHLKN
jgi:hypothetical protein